MLGNRKPALAVDGQGLYFYYGRKKKVPILNDVNIAVTPGVIYSLLGPSGCGKTTLLKCVMGHHKPQEGSLTVYGKIPGSKRFPIPGRGVGYMPQDTSLYHQMSIEEIMLYFGSLYGMNRQHINERINFLLELLALPGKKRIIGHLSGGQQRRVSFAVALLHKPPLVILDEPTVGVDPLLRQTIWNHLVTLAKNDHLTIIITTHYTEEARQADIVGFMRNGHLLVEGNPENLIRWHGAATLEEVFLRLCQNKLEKNEDDERSHILTTVESDDMRCPMEKRGTVLTAKGASERFSTATDHVGKDDETAGGTNGEQEDGTTLLLAPSSLCPKELDYTSVRSVVFSSLLRFICLSRKNILLLTRNIFFMLFAIGIPALVIASFCLSIGSDPFHLSVAVVNVDEGLKKHGENYLHRINNRTIHQVKFENFSAAYESVKRGESEAAIYIGSNFSDCMDHRILEDAYSSIETFRCSMVKMYLDDSNYVNSRMIYDAFLDSYVKFSAHLLQMYGKSALLAGLPVNIEEYIYGSTSSSMLEFLTPAMLLSVAYIFSVALTSMSVVEERRTGLLERSFAAGATSAEMLLSIFIVLMMVLILQVTEMVAFAFFIFHVPYSGPLFWIFVGIMLAGLSGMAYGFLIATMTDDMLTAVIASISPFFPIIFLSGMPWPLEAIPYYVRYFSFCLPLTKIIDSMRSIVNRGWTVSDNNIWDGYLICSFWIISTMLLSIAVLKSKK